MSRDRDLEPFSDSVDSMFMRLGIPNPQVMATVVEEWEEIAGTPWIGRSKPLYIQASTLVVEASSSSIIAFLRYDAAALVERLSARLGDGVITEVEIQNSHSS